MVRRAHHAHAHPGLQSGAHLPMDPPGAPRSGLHQSGLPHPTCYVQGGTSCSTATASSWRYGAAYRSCQLLSPPPLPPSVPAPCPPSLDGDSYTFVECTLPVGSLDFSVVTKEDCELSSHSHYRGLAIVSTHACSAVHANVYACRQRRCTHRAVHELCTPNMHMHTTHGSQGGTLYDTSPQESGTVGGPSWVHALGSTSRFSWAGGVTYRQGIPFSWSAFEQLARTLVAGIQPGIGRRILA